MARVLEWQLTDAQKDAQLPFLPTSLQAAPARLDALEVDVAALDGRVDALELADIALDGRIDALELAEVALDGRVGAVEADLAAATPNATPLTLLRRDATAEAALGALQIDVAPPIPLSGAPGKLLWNDVDGTLEFQLEGGNVTLQLGQEQVLRVRNGEVTPLAEGEVVYISGSTGVHNIVLRATNTTEATSDRALGIVTEAIAASPGEGFITTLGLVRNINTNHLTEGALVYLGTAGTTTATPPVAPAHQVIVGYCVKKSGGAGVIYVHVTTYPELSELHDVTISAPANGNFFQYDGTKWVNNTVLTSGRIPFVTTNGRLSDVSTLTRDPTTGDITIAGGAKLTLSGADALGEGNIILAAAASAAFDTNLVLSDATTKTMGYICGSTPGFAGAYGPFFGLRGNTYAAYANQRGNIFLYGGKPSGPGATEGRVILGTNDTERLEILYGGDVKVKTGSVYIVQNVLVLPKTSGYGVMVDTTSPTYGWRDLTCAIDPKATGLGTPTRVVYRGTIYGYAFTVGDLADFDGFHIPHDYVPGSNLYVHIHWSHNGTAISGTAAFEVTMTYAKGHNQADFPAEVTQTITVATPDIATVPRYRHRVDEVQASTPGGSATLHNTTDLEVDGLMLGYIKLITLPVITGGSLFIHTVDVHYQSTNMATKQKSPNFYT